MALKMTCRTLVRRLALLDLMARYALSPLRIDLKGNFIEYPGG
jgi:hypothetical protein